VAGIGAATTDAGEKEQAVKLEIAQKILGAALAAARAHDFKPLTIAVLDARGALKAFAAEDGTSLKRGEIAVAKAAGALAMGLGSRTLGTMAAQRPQFVAAVTHVVGGMLIPVAGGVLVRDGTGELLGAVGVSGDTSDNDETAALAGIEAAGLKADPGA
jgi:uncharacterized protein GlcG (DUF336 family)